MLARLTVTSSRVLHAGLLDPPLEYGKRATTFCGRSGRAFPGAHDITCRSCLRSAVKLADRLEEPYVRPDPAGLYAPQ